MVSLVDGDGGVHDLGGDGVLLDDGLDMLVEVVVDVFTLDDWCLGGGVDGVVGYRSVTVSSDIGVEHSLGVVKLVMLEGLVLNRGSIVSMLLSTVS